MGETFHDMNCIPETSRSCTIWNNQQTNAKIWHRECLSNFYEAFRKLKGRRKVRHKQKSGKSFSKRESQSDHKYITCLALSVIREIFYKVKNETTKQNLSSVR